MAKDKKIGIFSGTFDPIHDGHVWLVEQSITNLGLDEVLILVEKSPARKKQITSYQHRKQMVNLAFKHRPEVKTNVLQSQKDGVNYTVKSTLFAVYQYASQNADIWIILGGDVFEYVSSWPDYEQLISSCSFYVCLRSEDDGEIAVNVMQSEMQKARVKLISTEHPKISSTRIRSAIKNNQAPQGLNEEVYGYIQQHKLYS